MEYKLELSGEGSLCMEWFSLKNRQPNYPGSLQNTSFSLQKDRGQTDVGPGLEAHFTMNLIHEKELATRHPGVEETTELHTPHQWVEDLRSLDTTDVGGSPLPMDRGDKLQGKDRMPEYTLSR